MNSCQKVSVCLILCLCDVDFYGCLNTKTYIMQHFHIKMSKSNFIFITYFVELCAYISANVSNKVQTPRKL